MPLKRRVRRKNSAKTPKNKVRKNRSTRNVKPTNMHKRCYFQNKNDAYFSKNIHDCKKDYYSIQHNSCEKAYNPQRATLDLQTHTEKRVNKIELKLYKPEYFDLYSILTPPITPISPQSHPLNSKIPFSNFLSTHKFPLLQFKIFNFQA